MINYFLLNTKIIFVEIIRRYEVDFFFGRALRMKKSTWSKSDIANIVTLVLNGHC